MVTSHNQQTSNKQASIKLSSWHRLLLSSTNVWRKFVWFIPTEGRANISRPSSTCMSPPSHNLPIDFQLKLQRTSSYGVARHSPITTTMQHHRVPYVWKICVGASLLCVDTRCVPTASRSTHGSITHVRSVAKSSPLNQRNSVRCLYIS